MDTRSIPDNLDFFPHNNHLFCWQGSVGIELILPPSLATGSYILFIITAFFL